MQPGLASEPARGHPFLSKGRANTVNEVCNHTGNKSISVYALQGQSHIGICSGVARRWRMERTPDERREILRRFINERGWQRGIARWAKNSGVDKNSIYNFLNGHSDALAPITYAKLARTAEVPPWRLSGDTPEPPSPTSIWVSGHVEAGSFREAVEWDRSRWYAIDVPVPERFQRRARALEVRGNSMNLEYRPGAVVIWVDYLDFRPPRHGDHVIVYSYSAQDGEIEATIKELRVVEGKQWLWPRSDDPEHQQPVQIETPPHGVERIEIKGIVIGDFRRRAY